MRCCTAGKPRFVMKLSEGNGFSPTTNQNQNLNHHFDPYPGSLPR